MIRRVTAIFVISMFLFTILPYKTMGENVFINDGFAAAEGESSPTVAGNVSNPWTSFAPVKPVKKVVVVNHDDQGYDDDYAYMAEVAANTFHHGGKVYGAPVLFYEKEHTGNDEERVLNGQQALHYCLQDYYNYSEKLDVLELVNMDSEGVNYVKGHGDAKETVKLGSGDMYKLAGDIAAQNWEYSAKAVVAVVHPDVKFSTNTVEGSISGTLPNKELASGSIDGEIAPTPTDPNEHEFNIGEGYVFVEATMTWGNENSPLNELTERGKDPDLQLYDMQLGQVSASGDWNVLSGPREYVSSYVYNSGKWKFGVTYMPTQQKALEYSKQHPDVDVASILDSLNDSRSPDTSPIIPRPWDPTAYYTISYTAYPGTVMEIPQKPKMGSRQLEVTLEGGTGEMGICLLDSNGAEVHSVYGSGDLKIISDTAGMGTYKVAVFNMDGSSGEFTVDYKWTESQSESWSRGLENAANGAVLASMMNAPLLYSKSSGLNGHTADTLDLLGVRDCYVVSPGFGTGGLMEDLKGMRSWLQPTLNVHKLDELGEVYDSIRGISKSEDIVFTTTNPWTYWYVGKGPQGELPGSLAIGPAALSAAHHGAPVIVADNHEETANAQAWHNAFWVRAYDGRLPPSVGAMVLSAEGVYRYLFNYGLDGKGVESVITVGGQFDIGISWDRAIVGAAHAGRFFGSPLDEAAWIARSSFYPALIHTNPAVNPDGISLWTGSESTRVAGTLTITREEREEKFVHPTLQTWVSYQHRFNERGSEYWGCPYTDSLGISPYFTESSDPYDEGVCEPYKSGTWYPDMTSSEVIPKYTERGGMSSAYTTNFPRTMENLNRGTLIWYEVMHGGNRDGGIVGFWLEDQPESNPWRGYEENAMVLRGATDDPDVSTMSKMVGLDVTPGVSGPGGVVERHDGIIIALLQQTQTGLTDGLDFDDAMDNIHCVGFNAGSCLIAATYLQLSLIRHGSIFQVIDPWLTSWYSAMAMGVFAKGIAKGQRVGQCYTEGIHHVGIEYLTKKWWWDMYENVCYYGDPDLMMWTPNNAWGRPAALKDGKVVGGHAVFGAKSHPNAIGDTTVLEVGIVAAVVAVVLTFGYLYKTKRIRKILNRKGGSKNS